VVGGALLAENAGAALLEIDQVSNQIASLVQNISASARSQSVAAQNLARNMQVLREISAQSADSTSATSQAIVKLADLSAALRKSIAGFRLPGATETTGMYRSSASGASAAIAATMAAAAAANPSAATVAGTANPPAAGYSSPKIKALGGS
jgi:twitching motility protein PilJ